MKELLKKKIKKNYFLYKIISRIINKDKIIYNFYKKEYKKRILISYISTPFFKNQTSGHSNFEESKIIAKFFDQQEYIVDIVNFNTNREINLSKYDIIFGFGNLFEKSFYEKNFKGKRIFYATGAEPSFQINAEIERVKSFNKRNKTKLLPKRIPPNFWPLSFQMCDAMIVIGNDWTKSTWRKFYDGKILTQVGSNLFHHDTSDKIQKNPKEYVFIGSYGSIHKGLDLCVEIFKELGEDYILNIFAIKENDFWEAYSNIPTNIKFYGFKDINSNEFLEVIRRSTFIISPTCSEGSMTSLLLGIGNGLLPLATKETGVDFPKEFLLNSIEKGYMKNKIVEYSSLDKDILKDKSEFLSRKIRETNSLESFEKNLKENFKKIIESFN